MFKEGGKEHGNFNLFVLKDDENIEKYDKSGTIGQIFVDLWNLNSWYANDFLKALEERIKKYFNW